MGKAFAWMAGSYFAWVFIRNGTATKIISDTARGANDVTKGLAGAAKLA